MEILHLKTAILKATIVLVPSYTAAALTDKMVWVVPTLAASSFFAATIGMSGKDIRRTVDDDSDTGPDSENLTEILETPETHDSVHDFDGDE